MRRLVGSYLDVMKVIVGQRTQRSATLRKPTAEAIVKAFLLCRFGFLKLESLRGAMFIASETIGNFECALSMPISHKLHNFLGDIGTTSGAVVGVFFWYNKGGFFSTKWEVF